MALRNLMALQARARIVALVLLGLTLTMGFMVGRAWDVVGSPEGDAVAMSPETSPQGEAADQSEDEPDAAEDRQPGNEGGRGPVIYQVGLHDAQRADVDEIIAHFRASMRALDEQARRDYDEKQSALLIATRDSIKAVLNPDQIARYDSLLAARYGPGGDDNGSSRRDRRRDDPR